MFRVIVLLLGLWLAFDIAAHLVAETLWFQEVGYSSVWLLQLKTQLALWAIALFTTATFIHTNLSLAQRLKHIRPKDSNISEVSSLNLSGSLRFSLLIPTIFLLSLLLGLLLLYYGKVAFNYWHPNLSLANIYPNPPIFSLSSLWQILRESPNKKIDLGVLIVTLVFILIKRNFALQAIATLISLAFGIVLSGQWARVLQYFHPIPFNQIDPLFNQDISFYTFILPGLELLEFWLFGLFLYVLIAVLLVYILSGNSLSQGEFYGFSPAQLRHLYPLTSAVMLSVAIAYWLHRYKLLYSPRGVTYGASYTDVTVNLPVDTCLSLTALAIAIFLIWQTIFWQDSLNIKQGKTIFWCLVIYLITSVIISRVLPTLFQKLVVQPNELAKERPYLQRSIRLTRQAFNLENIEVKTFDPQGKLTLDDLKNNDETIRNIRLWDSRPLLETNRQLQQIRLYYKFANADIDRYPIKTEQPKQTPINNNPLPTNETEKRQVILSPRELDYSALPKQAKTWVNQHLVYTHGYGFTLSPVNTVAPGGIPAYFIKDIGAASTNEDGSLWTANDRIRASIPIGYPRIYYGEITDPYIMTGTKVKEFDYPSGSANVDNTYDGRGGIAIASLWRRLLFAEYLKDWQMLLTTNFTPQTKLLFHRNIGERVRATLPFLRYDSDPYLVVANTQNWENDLVAKKTNIPNYLYWVIDAYTTSDRYPYSDLGQDEFNYIRNSVKVVIDAYNGDISFYIADPQDPIVTSWKAIFPGLFKPLEAMPAELRKHLRYPVDLFNIQSNRLLAYHMIDPAVFYNREDQWQIPSEIYGSKSQPVEPYYLIMKLPTASTEEFILLHPFTPAGRTNLIAWLAARMDGEEYGKLLLYQFPKQRLVYGTQQIEALINQDPEISRQISLWNREGSRAIQGNLLVIPIERSLIYVEPLYLEAEQNSLPTLVRVIVVYENRIVMASTLDQALQAIFQPSLPLTPAIVRPVLPSTP